MKEFRKLKIWQRSHEFVLSVYVETQKFPREEQFGLTSQLRRSALSIPSNIAEGCGRSSDKELVRFCQIAMGSAYEAEYQLQLAHELQYVDPSRYESQLRDLIEIKKMLYSYIHRMKSTAHA